MPVFGLIPLRSLLSCSSFFREPVQVSAMSLTLLSAYAPHCAHHTNGPLRTRMCCCNLFVAAIMLFAAHSVTFDPPQTSFINWMRLREVLAHCPHCHLSFLHSTVCCWDAGTIFRGPLLLGGLLRKFLRFA